MDWVWVYVIVTYVVGLFLFKAASLKKPAKSEDEAGVDGILFAISCALSPITVPLVMLLAFLMVIRHFFTPKVEKK